jgi:transposase-like protein
LILIWAHLNTLLNYPKDIRKAIYTTNAIESLNSVIRKVIKKRKQFPNDDSAKKVCSLGYYASVEEMDNAD